MKETQLSKAFEIGKDIAFLHRSGNYFFSHTVNSVELGNAHIAIIFYLSRNPNCSQDDLTKALEVDKATITRGIDKLEKAGVVMRQSDSEDKRVKRIHLTEKGLSVCSELRTATHLWHNILLEGFSEEETKQVHEIFEKLVNNARLYRNIHCKALQPHHDINESHIIK